MTVSGRATRNDELPATVGQLSAEDPHNKVEEIYCLLGAEHGTRAPLLRRMVLMSRERFEPMTIVGLVAAAIVIYDAFLAAERVSGNESRSREHEILVRDFRELDLVER